MAARATRCRHQAAPENAGFGKCGHPGTIRAVLAIALDLAPDAALRFFIDPFSSPRIDRLENGWCVGAVNRR